MKKYRVDKFFNNQHLSDYFDDRMSAMNFAINAARSIFSGPVFLLSDPCEMSDGSVVYDTIEEVKA